MDSTKKYEAFFSSNGNVVVNEGRNRVLELKKDIPILYAEFLEKKGYDPEDFLLILPTGTATLTRVAGGGWSWRFDDSGVI